MVEFVAKVLGINKLLDYTASGVGAVAGPMLANWRASREERARLTSARADAEVRRIEAQSEAEASLIIAKARAEAAEYLLPVDAEVRGTIEVTREDITESIEFQGRKRLANIKSVVNYAADELGDKEVANHEPDPDWTARFFDCVQDVSSEGVQKIWAKILAGEVESPGRTSHRTLSILRDMSQSDARKFSDLMRFRISNFILGTFAEQVTDGALDTSFLTIVDTGLAYSSMVAYSSITLSHDGIYDKEYHDHVLRIEGPPGTEINPMDLTVTVLTPSGEELARFCEDKPNVEYLSCFARYLEKYHCKLKLAPVSSRTPDGRMMFDPKTMRIL